MAAPAVWEQEARDRLSALLKPGDVIYTGLRSVASSGMSRHINVYVVQNGRIRNINRDVATLAGFKVSDKTGALVVGGAGMDMGFHVVYSLSSALFPDGGYALVHEWI